MDVFPMTRDCATQLGTGMTSGGYQFVDGTGTWCSSSNGAAKLQLQEALDYCAGGENGVGFQGRSLPCVGIVFNDDQPGDEGCAHPVHAGAAPPLTL